MSYVYIIEQIVVSQKATSTCHQGLTWMIVLLNLVPSITIRTTLNKSDLIECPVSGTRLQCSNHAVGTCCHGNQPLVEVPDRFLQRGTVIHVQCRGHHFGHVQ